MKINALKIDGFGAWSDLSVEGLSDGLNVIYGPNEAGKTTLLQFVRSMLYGFSPQRRRYLPPVHGGRPGGTVDVAGPNGRFQIGRHEDADAEGVAQEQVTLTAPDGTRQGEHFLKVLLSNVDEAIFNNVFAVGLREMQELGALGDTEAASLLYNLTSGLDRVSLVEVMHELEASRNRILDVHGKPCQVVQLLAEREKLHAEIEELSGLGRRYAHLAAERGQLDRDVVRVQEESNGAERQATVLELAIALRGRWAQRAAIDEQISVLGVLKPMPDGAVERLDAIHVRLQEHQQHVAQLDEQREALKREFASLPVSETLWRQAARIEAFKEQESWITQLQGQIGELQKEVAEVEFELAGESERLGLGSEPVALPAFSNKALAVLRAPAKALRQCRGRRSEAAQQAADAQENVDSLTRQIDAALAARNERDLTAAMDRAGAAVAQLRRRVQIDERLDQLARYQVELEERSRQLVDRQLLPVWVLAGLGTAFVLGVVLVLAGLLMPATITGSLGWSLALLGLAGSGAAGFGKMLLERSNAQQLETCQKQLAVLQMQLQQTKEDRDALDAQLPRGGGPLAARLQTAERDLAALEELTPLDTRRSAARQELDAAARRSAQAEEEHKTAARRWRQAAASVGLPEKIVPKQVRRLMQRSDRIAEMQRRLTQRREELVRRQRELDALAGRLLQVAADGGVTLAGTNPVEHLRQLVEAIGRQESAVARRNAIRRQARRALAVSAKHAEAVSRLKHRRRELLLESGADDEREFRERAVRHARAEVLRSEREALAREILAALASHCSEAALREQIEAGGPSLESRRDELRQRLDTLTQQLHGLLEQRGQIAEQLRAVAADRQLAMKQLQLAVVDQRLAEAVRRWQTLAATCSVLEMIRTTYEKQRQPETLQEASGYLERLTQGRYCRVWTPLGENVLRVDDAGGNSLPVEVLSRGTREQLFLSLRLALTSCYARRGCALPLVLDDVLVNFDAQRAEAAAAVLRDFAATGRQLLVFTCHEHILRLFKALKAPVGELPSNAIHGPTSIRFEQRSEEKAKPAKVATSPRKKPAQPRKAKPAEEPEPVVEARMNGKKQDDRVFDVDFFDAHDGSDEPKAELDAAEEESDDDWDDDDEYEEIDEKYDFQDDDAEAA